MSYGGTVTPPQSNTTQIPTFGVNVPTSAQQQQQQLQNTLSQLFPSGMPFNFPRFDALGATTAASGTVASSADGATFPPALHHLHFDAAFAGQHNSRIKIKRCRQRVDAGEPRNAYQSQLKNGVGQRKEPISLNDLSQQLSLNFDIHSNNNNHTPFRIRNGTPSENDYADEIDGTDGSENGALNCSFSASKSASSSTSSVISSSAKRKSFLPKRQHTNEDEVVAHINNNNECETNEEPNESNRKNGCPENGTQSSLKIIINQRHNTVRNVKEDVENCVNEIEEEQPECSGEHELIENNVISESLKDEGYNVDEDPEQQILQENSPNETVNETEFQKQGIPSTYMKEEVESERSSPAETNLLTSLFLTNNNNNDNNNDETEKCENNNNADLNRIQSILEHQRKIYSAIFIEQQRKNLSVNAEAVEELSVTKEADQISGSSSLLFQQQQNFPPKSDAKLAAPLGGIFGRRKLNGNEQLAHLFRFIEAMTLAQRQQQMLEIFQQQKLRCQQQPQQPQHLNPRVQNLLVMAAAATAAAASNRRNSAQVHNALSGSHPAFRFGENNNTVGSGIFPNNGTISAPFSNFIGSSLFPSSAPIRDDSGPRRKRAKVTDSVRGPRSGRADCVSATSPPTSERSSPQATSAYFPPTMVAHPSLYGRAGGSRNDSPHASDELGASDYFGGVGSLGMPINPLDGLNPQEYTLNHVHLRKAKLMFFYTRYPSSAVLKTYFPDIQFNKNNTAQLVKWFSNFREFYYMQMEKYAKQAIAEGIRHRNDIIVTPESEIYKQLNQHYNRNNLLQPPARLQYVIQETLKEFFVALQAGKDSEPSWKKVIYKIIQQYDDPIPEYFKDPNFIETIEQS